MQETKPYRLVRSRRRTIALIVKPDASLLVRAPHREPLHSIERFIREKSAWIRRAIAWMESRPRPPLRRFETGETFLFLGEPRILTVVPDGEAPLDFRDGFLLQEDERPLAAELFADWFRAEAKKRVLPRAAELAAQHGFRPVSLRINGARRRWGSCSADGRLNFSWRLVMAPPFAIDYVILHELAHLRHSNHSRAFWDCVASLCSGHATARRWLRENAPLLAWE